VGEFATKMGKKEKYAFIGDVAMVAYGRQMPIEEIEVMVKTERGFELARLTLEEMRFKETVRDEGFSKFESPLVSVPFNLMLAGMRVRG